MFTGSMLGIAEYFVWWQLPLALALIGLIVFWVMYRKRQM